MDTKKYISFVFLFSITWVCVVAQPSPRRADGTREVELRLKATRTIEFSTTEGTHISLDASPDGRTIVFDRLGDLYTLPIEGGTAVRLTHGIEWDVTPRFSPDGGRVVFTSDRSGAANLWTVRADGTGLSKITNEKTGRLISPTWSPDGRFILVAKESLSADETLYLGGHFQLWQYDVETGAGSQLSTGGGVTGGAAYDNSGRTVFYVRSEAPNSAQSIMAVDIKTGRNTAIDTADETEGRGRRPLMSPDGRWLAYANVKDTKHPHDYDRWVVGLRIRAMDSDSIGATDLPLGGPQMSYERHSTLFAHVDAIPGYAFTPDSRSVVFAADGKIHRIDLETKAITQIPFSADIKAELAPLIANKIRLPDTPLDVRGIHDANESPDGKSIVFFAVGKVWTMPLVRGAKPRRLTPVTNDDPITLEYEPVFSPDGKWIAYVRWSHTKGGHIIKIPVGGGPPTTVMTDNVPRAYTSLRWADNGNRLVFFSAPVNDLLSGRESDLNKWKGFTTRLGWVDATGGSVHLFPEPSFLATPRWADRSRSLSVGADGQEVTWIEPRPASDGQMNLQTAPLDTTDRTQVTTRAIVPPSGLALRSPDGEWVVRVDMGAGFGFRVEPFPQKQGASGSPPRLGSGDSNNTGFRVEPGNTFDVRWSPDGQWLTWTWASKYYRIRWAEVLANRGKVTPQETAIDLRVKRDRPTGNLLLRGARVITMNPRGVRRVEPIVSGAYPTYRTDPMVIDRADILIKGRRIVAVSPSGTIKAPTDVRTIDLDGKTVIPGMIEMHAHPRDETFIPTLWPNSGTELAFGVTSVRSPGMSDKRQNARAELVEMGKVVGARHFGSISLTQYPSAFLMTLPIAEQVNAHRVMDVPHLKQYSSPDRSTEQEFAILANNAGLNLIAHAHVGPVFDGYTSIEHTWPISYGEGVRNDWKQLLARSGTTLSVSDLMRGPRSIALVGRTQLRFPWSYRNEMPFDPARDRTLAKSARSYLDFLRAGGNLVNGYDTPSSGPYAHEFMQTVVALGEFTPAEALGCVTMNAARALGVGDDLGSIEVGKIADLVVLNSNPLDDVKNATDIAYVLKDGFMYEGSTLNMVWSHTRPYPQYPWLRKPGEIAPETSTHDRTEKDED